MVVEQTLRSLTSVSLISAKPYNGTKEQYGCNNPVGRKRRLVQTGYFLPPAP